MKTATTFLAALLLLPVVARAEDPIAKAIDDLSGDYATAIAARKTLYAASAKAAVPLLIERLEKNVAAGVGCKSRTEMIARKEGEEKVAAPILAENDVIAKLLVDFLAPQGAPAVEKALVLATREKHTQCFFLASAFYILSGRNTLYWNPNEKRVTTFVIYWSDEAMRQNMLRKLKNEKR